MKQQNRPQFTDGEILKLSPAEAEAIAKGAPINEAVLQQARAAGKDVSLAGIAASLGMSPEDYQKKVEESKQAAYNQQMAAYQQSVDQVTPQVGPSVPFEALTPEQQEALKAQDIMGKVAAGMQQQLADLQTAQKQLLEQQAAQQAPQAAQIPDAPLAPPVRDTTIPGTPLPSFPEAMPTMPPVMPNIPAKEPKVFPPKKPVETNGPATGSDIDTDKLEEAINSTAEKVEHESKETVHRCSNCGWTEGKDPYDVTDADKVMFARYILGLSEFRKTYELLDGRLSVTFRTYSHRVQQQIIEEATQETREGKIPVTDMMLAAGAYTHRLRHLHMAAALVQVSGYNMAELPAFGTPEAEALYEGSIATAYDKIFGDWHGPLVNIVFKQYVIFEQTVARLMEGANSPDFYKVAGV